MHPITAQVASLVSAVAGGPFHRGSPLVTQFGGKDRKLVLVDGMVVPVHNQSAREIAPDLIEAMRALPVLGTLFSNLESPALFLTRAEFLFDSRETALKAWAVAQVLREYIPPAVAEALFPLVSIITLSEHEPRAVLNSVTA